MNTIRPFLAAALAGLLLVAESGRAPRISTSIRVRLSGGDANVLIVLDNESNWGATMDSSPPADADSVAGCGGSTGSYFCAQKYALIKLLTKTNRDRQLFRRRTRSASA